MYNRNRNTPITLVTMLGNVRQFPKKVDINIVTNTQMNIFINVFISSFYYIKTEVGIIIYQTPSCV